MRQKQVIEYAVKKIERYAYYARICDELAYLDFDRDVFNRHRHNYTGQAVGLLEILYFMTGHDHSGIFNKATSEACIDCRDAQGNIEQLLNLAGFDGKAYLKCKGQV